MRHKLPSLRSLDRFGDIFLVAYIFFFAASVPTLMRMRLSTVGYLLEPRRVPAAVDPARVQKLIAYIEYMLEFGSPILKRGCLTRGLTLYYFLRRMGLNVSLCFGIGKVNNAFAGHCWLMKDEQLFLESSDPRAVFVQTYSFPR